MKDLSLFTHFQMMGRKTVEGCEAFVAMLDDPRGLFGKAQRIKEIEHECDEIVHSVMSALHKTLITPIDRNDIHALITKMDDVMDLVEAAAERLALFELTTMTKEVRDLAGCLVSSAQHVLGAAMGIRDLGRPAMILEHCREIDRLENVADGLLRGALAKLFREEKDPITIVKWKEIYETLEAATDRCEDVANIIEGVVLENG